MGNILIDIKRNKSYKLLKMYYIMLHVLGLVNVFAKSPG